MSLDAPPVATGLLVFCTRPLEGDLPLEAYCNASLVGAKNGMLVFVDIDHGMQFILYPDEIVRFDTTVRA